MADPKDIIAFVRKRSGKDPQTWTAPLEAAGLPTSLEAVVAYAKADDGTLWFMANVSFDARGANIIATDDLDEAMKTFLADTKVHEGDRNYYRWWLTRGLKEALLRAVNAS